MGNNERIAKNTIVLYIRMIILMIISLFTSREILRILGVEDYGIYNVVAGVISMLGFLSGSLAVASSRYITFGLGKGNIIELKKVFGNIKSIHLLLAVIVIIVGETVGLWFVMTQLSIPQTRLDATFWVYQCSVVSFVLSVVSAPYNACIIAHEKMSTFAYIGIIDAVLKLLIVYLLLVIQFDKLIIYAALFLLVQVFDRIVYGIYCKKHFEEVNGRVILDKQLFKEIFAFAGWNLGGNLAVVGYTQGLNVLLNIFFGPTVNAARGVAVQVQNAVYRFCSSFQTAINPQLTKSYAIGEYKRMHYLMKISSKFSFYLMLLLSIPVILEAPILLNLWLDTVPDHTITFLRLILCTCLLYALSNPVIISIHATGNIKKFQIIECCMLLSIVPIAYVLLKFFHLPPESVFIVHIVVEICTQCARVGLVLPRIHMPIQEYIYDVVIPILKVLIASPVIPIFLYLNLDRSVFSFIIVCMVSFFCTLLATYYLGCTASEKRYFINIIVSKIKRLK